MPSSPNRAAFDEADTISPIASNAFHRSRDLLKGARRDGRCPSNEAARLDKAVHRLAQALAGARQLRQVDREDYEATLQQARAVRATLGALTPARTSEVRAQAHSLMNAVESGTASGRDLESAVLLACLAQPEGREYWDLARGARGLLVAMGAEGEGLRAVMRLLAPDEVFGEGPSYPSAPRGGSRVDRVYGVARGGLPGLGRRA